ncbi:SDR family NAD(P)-dependent oxidoreductase [Arthrobacter sp. SLBN-112]|uniref:SDR family NAD(P)-dependent oxidoreductase n=1 Tax=Arthrobacter sp. SLBN-112 TaxID=2768452 RepID=UPI00114F4BED
MPDFRLDGKKALVTGAARGLGQAIADGLAESGATVYGTSRDAESARRISERYGTSALPLDITEPAQVLQFADDLVQESGGIDLLVNNAGVNVPKPALELTTEDWDTVFDTNLNGRRHRPGAGPARLQSRAGRRRRRNGRTCPRAARGAGP